MRDLNAIAFTEWFEGLDGSSYSPEDALPRDGKSPFGDFEVVQDQRDIYQPDSWSVVVKVGDRYFERTGYYSSWDGVDWEMNGHDWEEVYRKEKVEVYYG